MKITFIETYIDGIQQLGSDLTSIYKNLDTKRKLDNAIKRHVIRLNSLKNIKPFLKGNYQIKFISIYR